MGKGFTIFVINNFSFITFITFVFAFMGYISIDYTREVFHNPMVFPAADLIIDWSQTTSGSFLPSVHFFKW